MKTFFFSLKIYIMGSQYKIINSVTFIFTPSIPMMWLKESPNKFSDSYLTPSYQSWLPLFLAQNEGKIQGKFSNIQYQFWFGHNFLSNVWINLIFGQVTFIYTYLLIHILFADIVCYYLGHFWLAIIYIMAKYQKWPI